MLLDIESVIMALIYILYNFINNQYLNLELNDYIHQSVI